VNIARLNLLKKTLKFVDFFNYKKIVDFGPFSKLTFFFFPPKGLDSAQMRCRQGIGQ
jgi:hypothetical protein